jgi:hypothetical protein
MEAALDSLLATAPAHDGCGTREAFEAILTAGYARALELEAERARLARELAIGGESRPAHPRLTALTERVGRLRQKLDEANRRMRASREQHLDRRPRTRSGPDEEFAS